MAEISLEFHDDGRVFVVIPPEYIDRFRGEAMSTLESAAQVIEELTRWNREARIGERDGVRRGLDARDLQKFHDAEEVYVDAVAEPFEGSDLEPSHEGNLQIVGKVDTLRSTVEGCVLDAAEAIQGEAEKRHDSDIRAAMAELEFWLGLRDNLRERAVA